MDERVIEGGRRKHDAGDGKDKDLVEQREFAYAKPVEGETEDCGAGKVHRKAVGELGGCRQREEAAIEAEERVIVAELCEARAKEEGLAEDFDAILDASPGDGDCGTDEPEGEQRGERRGDEAGDAVQVAATAKVHPFYLAYALEEAPETLGDVNDWQAEWKWDGIRGQMIKRNNELFIWSRGEDLMTDKFPEYYILKDKLPNGIVLDGEIIPAKGGKPLPFALLQTRIGRKNITKKQLEEAPIAFFAYDLLEMNGEDWRNKPLSERREALEKVVKESNNPTLLLSDVIEYSSWDKLAKIREGSRDAGAEGLMLKNKHSVYKVGRKVGDWWKWKIEPLTIDAVMIYAQKGAGRRSNLYTDYTFAVKDGDKLVPFTKAYSGLTDKEFNEVDAFVKRNSLEKFGPVRTVKPELVFELAFEGIAASNRHKSGVALRFPRILRWRKDKPVDEINTLDDLKRTLSVYGKS